MKLVYIHIPKTSGSAFRTSLLKNFANSQYFICTGGNRTVKPYLEHSLDAFHKLQNLSSIQLFLGHMPYGIHRLLEEECRYFTFLREPFDRVLSEYFYIVGTKHNQNHVHVQNLDLKEYVEGDIFLPNLQSRMISGILDPEAKEPELLAAAKANLENQFTFTGIYEKLPESIVLFEKIFGIQIGDLPRVNPTTKRKKVSEVDADTLEVIRSNNLADIALYEWASNRFTPP